MLNQGQYAKIYYMVTLTEEKKLWRKGFDVVVGLDEVGRGSLAGSVVVCAATYLKEGDIDSNLLRISRSIKDSKELSPNQREEFYKELNRHPKIEWVTRRVSEKVIDRVNILEATKIAMKRAVKGLREKLKDKKIKSLIIDGNFKIDSSIPQKSITKADQKVFSVAAASVIAKVTRDRMMIRYDKKYPVYYFGKHKGYPTQLHRKLLIKYGPCKIHRKSFGPVSYLNKRDH